MTSSSGAEDAVTSLLESAEADGQDVWEQLVPLIYDQLRSLARTQLAKEAEPLSLNTTDLVHEAYLRLVDDTRVVGKGRGYFFGAAGRAMRQILVDHARRRHRTKHGGGRSQVTLDPDHPAPDASTYDLMELNQALDRLSALYPRAARVVECRLFGGLDTDRTAEALGLSPRTVKRDWALARAWLYREVHGSDAPADD
jgi:RNA polymerase sigma factor (TIGR02999 family)